MPYYCLECKPIDFVFNPDLISNVEDSRNIRKIHENRSRNRAARNNRNALHSHRCIQFGEMPTLPVRHDGTGLPTSPIQRLEKPF